MRTSEGKYFQTQAKNPCRSPVPNASSSSSLFRDISNFKTPKQPSRTFHSQITTPQFFTACKQTPASTSSAFSAVGSRRRRPSMAPTTTAAKARAGRRFKELELEQSQSCRRELIKKEKSMKSLAGSLTAWLNFLFENPIECGCRDTEGGLGVGVRWRVGKRESWVRRREEEGIKVDGFGRLPKRQKAGTWSDLGDGYCGNELEISSCQFADLQRSLRDLCSFDDMKGRMREYLSLSACKEIFNVMTRVTKNIDEGRLKMKPHCPLVTDVGIKDRAVKALLNYNPAWLRVGLYIIFGGESLLFNGDSVTDEDIGFLKMVIEKQVFSHAGLAKAFSYNKKVEGLYRPGYFESLGDVILKRFLLLVLILDRAKSQSSLPIKYGVDGLDGGSPLLFTRQSNIKSSQQMITDFLISEVMHGEGNLLAHLVMIGYKVSYEQLPLVEYDFRVGDLFEDIQDGVKLCRTIQLLQHDSSILTKMALPSNNYKKRLANCNMALQYLKISGVPLHDDEGMLITGDDVVNGDRELILSLLWNVFVHLQIPLLITKTTLHDEICKISKANSELKDLDSSSHLDMLLNWMKAICENYDNKTERLTSPVDGQAMWCLLDFYFRKELRCSCSPKDMGDNGVEESIVSSMDRSNAVHNFVLSQKLTTLLGNVPQVLQTSDIIEYNGPCNNRSVLVLLVFLSTQLLVKKSKDQLNFHKLMGCRCQDLEQRRSSVDRLSKNNEAELIKDEDYQQTLADAARKFKAVKAWWQEMAKQNGDCIIRPARTSFLHFSTNKHGSNISKEKAAIVIQSHVRRMSKRQNYLKKRKAVSCLQLYARAWLMRKHRIESQKEIEKLVRTIIFIVDRHKFVRLKRSALIIQSATRLMLLRNQRNASLTSNRASHVLENCPIQMNYQDDNSTLTCNRDNEDDDYINTGMSEHQNYMKTRNAVSCLQVYVRAWLSVKHGIESQKKTEILARTIIFMIDRYNFVKLKRSALLIQSTARLTLLRNQRNASLGSNRASHVLENCLIQMNNQDEDSSLTCISSSEDDDYINTGMSSQQAQERSMVCQSQQIQKSAITIVQRHCRGWLARQHIKIQKQAIITIQRTLRILSLWRDLNKKKVASRSAIVIQSCLRGWLARADASMRRRCIVVIQSNIRGWLARRVFVSQKSAAIVIQSSFRAMACSKSFSAYRDAAIEIQRFVRGRIARTRILGATGICAASMRDNTLANFGNQFHSTELKMVLCAIVKLQRWWRRAMMLRSRIEAATVIQSHFRGWIARRRAAREKHLIVLIQSNWKGYIARRNSKGQQLLDLRRRVVMSAANVDDGMRLINRHIAALNELLSMKSLSNILRNCATLDKATGLSCNCCEILVEAGAIDILLKQIKSVSRSIPDQEILKHTLSILRNLARYPHLADTLINHHESVETILWEMLRNKEEGYFIACDLLKKICQRKKGIENIHRLPFLLKRLGALVDELNRKASKEKRTNHHRAATRDSIERRLREAVEILHMIAHGGDHLDA